MAKKGTTKSKAPRATGVKEGAVFKHLLIKYVRLLSVESKLHIAGKTFPSVGPIEISGSLSPGPGGATMLVDTTVHLSSQEGDDSSIDIKVIYQCVYAVVGATAEDLQSHGELICGTGMMTSWPHLREFVRSLTMRMEVPVFTLPLIQIGPGGKPVALIPPNKPAAKKSARKKSPRKKSAKKKR